MKSDSVVDVIAIDGPAGSGKSTTARLVAKKLGFTFLDTGAMYRAFTLKAIRNNINLKDEKELLALAEKTDIKLFDDHGWLKILLDGEDVTREIRSEEVSRQVATVAAHPGIRKWMVKIQRKMGAGGKIVAEGRDIGTVVFDNARLKIFLVASLEERAKRRSRDYLKRNEKFDLQKVVDVLRERDAADSRRKVGPLKKAEDAVELDTTNLSIDQQVNYIVDLWKKRVAQAE